MNENLYSGNPVMTLQEAEEKEKELKHRLGIEYKKRDVLQKKLEECGNNVRTCDDKPLADLTNGIRSYERDLQIALMARMVRSFKKGDVITVVGNKKHGYRILDFLIMEAKVQRYLSHSNDYQEVSEVQIEEVKKDGRVVAKSTLGKTMFMGIYGSDMSPMEFFLLRK